MSTALSEAETTSARGRAEVERWVERIAALTRPDRVEWVTGAPEQRRAITELAVASGALIPLDSERRPDSYLARSSPDDVARVESRTFICSEEESDAGPSNNWRDPATMRRQLGGLFDGSMRGRTLYVVPYTMGVPGGELSRVGVQLTDSPYAVLSMGIMTRTGSSALERIDAGEPWVPAVHSVGAPLAEGEQDTPWPCNEEKYIVHFPETREIFSFGSGYGGNALLAKKCFALRIASSIGRDEGWLAEHMLLIRLISPEGKRFHVAAAFPSACGKTNLAMLQPTLPGWRVETLGDDIAWLKPGADGRLWAINPEAGFFGVAPGTGPDTNPAAVEMLWGNTIFTNVALTADGDVWWEGLSDEPPSALTDWTGQPWSRDSGWPAAHPNSRFTVAAAQCPSVADEVVSGAAVPLDAILFGGRRADTVPLVTEARSWAHGVFMGATMSSQRTAAAEGTVGELRRDPFAMLPFCGYNMADHWGHWLSVGERLGDGAPRIFQVNWFRRGEDGGFLWPGFGENSRVLEWIAGRVEGTAAAQDSPIGRVPDGDALRLDGLGLDERTVAELLRVDRGDWLVEAERTEEFFEGFDGRVPRVLVDELDSLRERLRHR
ncbi:phosphoenolpyruvate carboxykinase (GTP) [Mycetocola reblochoni]|uniref:Phosphoenolpyruvate carboxykinase [GTP] n=2 Tax=Mycetocola reblochoni TaxID=331618 RepID=A0A1R4JIS2_9MICO|nr:phosphoenolpyruvate carboxykinase (GTP) [Mycetocola reblochoni]RLP70543.1 phosphoenolpyruvate carboxykinase (GTP) [Mycetocola reblochoni]SJN31960.1 Phosphoenolpyruvate carboxykinase [GTP] [Mycetocola reblochoni REB411]